MSSCLSGRAYRLNLELIKPPTTTFSTSNSSSPSSTLSESSNSPLSIFTRKPRTPRKRPNQTYNEAAALLSTAYPKLFPPKNLPKSFKLTKSHSEPPDLLIPFHHRDDSQCLPPPRPCRSPGEVTSDLLQICDQFDEDFDAESILDEEIEEGIDSIMGNLAESSAAAGYCYGFPVGMGFDFDFGMGRRAMRSVGDGERWSSPSVNVVDITPPANKTKTKAKKKKEKQRETAALRLKLNYDSVLKAWSDKGSPFSGEAPAPGTDVQARLAQIELFPAARGAIVLRYKEKRRTRLFSKKITYQLRKANAHQRPRLKGRFVRTPNSGDGD